jgi:hypothetical protein
MDHAASERSTEVQDWHFVLYFEISKRGGPSNGGGCRGYSRPSSGRGVARAGKASGTREWWLEDGPCSSREWRGEVGQTEAESHEGRWAMWGSAGIGSSTDGPRGGYTDGEPHCGSSRDRGEHVTSVVRR